MAKKLRLMLHIPTVVIAVEVAAAVDLEAVDAADLVETDEEAVAMEAVEVADMEAEAVAVEDMEETDEEVAAMEAAAMAEAMVETAMEATKEITKPHCTVL